jgi:hypothetical protein
LTLPFFVLLSGGVLQLTGRSIAGFLFLEGSEDFSIYMMWFALCSTRIGHMLLQLQAALRFSSFFGGAQLKKRKAWQGGHVNVGSCPVDAKMVQAQTSVLQHPEA